VCGVSPKLVTDHLSTGSVAYAFCLAWKRGATLERGVLVAKSALLPSLPGFYIFLPFLCFLTTIASAFFDSLLFCVGSR
jgi:hypothetical protein